MIADIKGESDRRELMGRLQASIEDRNWDSIKGLWRMKEFIKREGGDVAKAFRRPTATDVFAALKESKAGRSYIADQLGPISTFSATSQCGRTSSHSNYGKRTRHRQLKLFAAI